MGRDTGVRGLLASCVHERVVSRPNDKGQGEMHARARHRHACEGC